MRLHVIVLIFCAFFTLSGCSIFKGNPSIRQQRKKEIAAKKAEKKAYKELKKSHLERQANDTRKMMKKMQKRNKKLIKPLRKKNTLVFLKP